MEGQFDIVLWFLAVLAAGSLTAAFWTKKKQIAYLGAVRRELKKEKQWLRRGEYNAAMVKGRQNLELLLKCVAENKGIQIDNSALAIANQKAGLSAGGQSNGNGQNAAGRNRGTGGNAGGKNNGKGGNAGGKNSGKGGNARNTGNGGQNVSARKTWQGRNRRGRESTMTNQQFCRWLADKGYLDRVAKWELNEIRLIGNRAVHENYDSKDEAWNQYNYLEDILKIFTAAHQPLLERNHGNGQNGRKNR